MTFSRCPEDRKELHSLKTVHFPGKCLHVWLAPCKGLQLMGQTAPEAFITPDTHCCDVLNQDRVGLWDCGRWRRDARCCASSSSKHRRVRDEETPRPGRKETEQEGPPVPYDHALWPHLLWFSTFSCPTKGTLIVLGGLFLLYLLFSRCEGFLSGLDRTESHRSA